MRIYVKLHERQKPLKILKEGEWIDLASAENMYLIQGKYGLLSLGISMKIPKGFEVIIAPRSSTFKNFGMILTNSLGIIDSSYSGTNDIWKFPYFSLKTGRIKKGDRICQFKIQLSQKATLFQKLRWLFFGKIKFVYVNELDNKDRGGFGSTGK